MKKPTINFANNTAELSREAMKQVKGGSFSGGDAECGDDKRCADDAKDWCVNGKCVSRPLNQIPINPNPLPLPLPLPIPAPSPIV